MNRGFTILCTTILIFLHSLAWGQINISSLNTAFTENFNGMGSSATATLPTGFKIGTDWSSGTTATTRAAGSTGTGVLNGTSGGGVHNFANGITASSTDRALGFLNSGSFATPNSIVLAITNNTGATITSLDISFDYEKYRSGSRAFNWTFFHGSTATPSTAATDGDQAYPANANNTTISNPPLSTAKTVSLTGLSIANGSNYYLRWTLTGVGGSSNGQAIGIDNFSITASGMAAPQPTITVTPTSLALNGYLEGNGPSAAKSYNLKGDNLTANITVSAPANFEISNTSATSGFQNSLTISPTSGSVNTTIYARLKSGLTANNYSGNISHASTDIATAVNLPISGSVLTITKISAIQGSGSTAALTGTQAIEGIVTKLFTGTSKLNGYYVQEEDADADADPATSEGIFIFDNTGSFSSVNVGDKVQIAGTVKEYTSGSSSLTEVDMSVAGASLNIVSSGNALPTVVDVKLPVANVSDLERYEGMLVNLSATSGNLTVTEYYQLGQYGQVMLSVDGASNQAGTDARLDQYTQFNAPSTSGNAAYQAEIAKRRIYLDDGSGVSYPSSIIFGRGGNPLSATNTLRGGDEVSNITAILDERFEGYRLQTTEGVNFQATNTRPTTPPISCNTLKVGGFNVLNYFNGNGTGGGFPTARGADNANEFTRQRNKILNVLYQSGADVLGLNEVENDGYGSTSAIQDLVNGLNDLAGAGTYAFINPNASISTDQITVAMVYKPAKVTPVGSAAFIPDGFGNGAFDVVGRKPLAQTFQDNTTGGIFTYVINHFKSKGSSSGGAGDSDTGDGQGASNGTRVRQSQDLLAWLATKPTGTNDPDYILGGDFNSYAMEDPLEAIENGGFEELIPNTSYSYVFNGQLGSLDHAFGSASLLTQVTAATKWHTNADEPAVLDYNVENKTVSQITSLYANDAFRAADHDPVIICLNATDNVPPVITCVNNVTKSATSALCAYKAVGTELDPASSSDNIGVVSTTYTLTGATTGTGSNTLANVSFNIGMTTIEWIVKDAAGNADTCSFTLTVSDTEKPLITCPNNIVETLASFECARTIKFNAPTVSDNCTVSSVTRSDNASSLVSGSAFEAGTYVLSYTAKDAANNESSCSFTIKVNGQTVPNKLSCLPALTVSLDSKKCLTAIDAAQLLTDGVYYCNSAYRISIPNHINNYVTSADLGQTVIATVSDNFNKTCSTKITVIDTHSPILIGLQDTSVNCSEVDKTGQLLLDLSQPTTLYECSKTTTSFSDKVLNGSFTTRPDAFPSDKNFNAIAAANSSKIIIRTYTVTDEYNNSTNIQRIIYVNEIALSQVECPKDVVGTCVQGNFDASIQATGTPVIKNGRLLKDVSCAIDYFYSDEKTTTTLGYTIKRTWTLRSRKTQEAKTCVQTITVTCAPIPLMSISGSISKETGENIIASVKLKKSNELINTIENSRFEFTNLSTNTSYSLSPERNNDVSNGITSFDIALMSKHILDIQPLQSPYQLIAADVNRDGEIDAVDMILIRNLILRRTSTFPNNAAWRFIPKNYTFQNPTNPFGEDFPEVLNIKNLNENLKQADFIAVKVGDINLTAKSDLNALITRNTTLVEALNISDKKLEAHKEYTFELNTSDIALSAIQLALKWDKNRVASFKVTEGNLPQFENGNIAMDEKEGTATTVWASSQGTNTQTHNIIQVTLIPTQAVWLHDVVSLDDKMENLAYNTEGVEKAIQLKFTASQSDNVPFELHQNRPNPFSQETTISFTLPETNTTELSIYDLNGRKIYSINKMGSKGYNEVLIPQSVLKSSGVYIYRLQSDKFTAVKRMQYFQD